MRRIGALTLSGLVAMMPARAQAQSISPLYVSFGALQVLDIHATTRAMHNGAAEGNALMAGVSGSPVALSIVKAGGAAATIFLAEKVRKRNRVAAVLLMVGVNSFYGFVVAHNYGAGSR